jgi:hypothetical protein
MTKAKTATPKAKTAIPEGGCWVIDSDCDKSINEGFEYVKDENGSKILKNEDGVISFYLCKAI